MKSTFKKMTALLTCFSRRASLTATAVAQLGAAQAGGWRNDDDQLAQMAELEQQFTRLFMRQSACTIQ